ncbi:MAG: DUF5690 family protein [Planctomycetaceae bacterium]|nr:DUF5690 family protein [Planctomycetaceae bacterium]
MNKPLTSPPTDTATWFWAFWSVTAAFGTYFCMYAFRKPFAAGAYADSEVAGIAFKTVLVTSQGAGYMLSKFIGIKVVSEMPPVRRPWAILALILLAELALLAYGLSPRPWNAVWLFANGLPLGMVFGLVLSCLEGRRVTDALTAGLCASFILADGVTKSVGSWLLANQISEDWMPAAAGLIFLPPLGIFVAMLSCIPQPTVSDQEARSERTTMSRGDRWTLFGKHAVGLSLIVGLYLLITILRSVRADFAPELWRGLGESAVPSLFTRSEMYVAFGVIVVNGSLVAIRDNRRAFFGSLAVCCAGLVLLLIALIGLQLGQLSAFPFMVLMGLGLYLPYVAVHTTVFERFLAMTRDRGSIGFLMSVADAIGYLGYVGVMLSRNLWPTTENFLGFFTLIGWLTTLMSVMLLALTWRYFSMRYRDPQFEPLPVAAV